MMSKWRHGDGAGAGDGAGDTNDAAELASSWLIYHNSSERLARGNADAAADPHNAPPATDPTPPLAPTRPRAAARHAAGRTMVPADQLSCAAASLARPPITRKAVLRAKFFCRAC